MITPIGFFFETAKFIQQPTLLSGPFSIFIPTHVLMAKLERVGLSFKPACFG
jgi:hypothetical protein